MDDGTGKPLSVRAAPVNAGQHAQWISGSVETLLAHYFTPELSKEAVEAAIDDWIKTLIHLSPDAIENACSGYLRDQPRRRPTPGDIRQRAESHAKARETNDQQERDPRLDLSHDELQLLEEKVLPTARRWVAEIPTLAIQGAKTLAHWGERVSLAQAKRLRRDHLVTMPADLTDNPTAFKAWLRDEAGPQQPEAAE
jgi:hypothetical protein